MDNDEIDVALDKYEIPEAYRKWTEQEGSETNPQEVTSFNRFRITQPSTIQNTDIPARGTFSPTRGASLRHGTSQNVTTSEAVETKRFVLRGLVEEPLKNEQPKEPAISPDSKNAEFYETFLEETTQVDESIKSQPPISRNDDFELLDITKQEENIVKPSIGVDRASFIKEGNVITGFFASLVTSMLVVILWVGFSMAFHRTIDWMAINVGIIAGNSMKSFGRGSSRLFKVATAIVVVVTSVIGFCGVTLVRLQFEYEMNYLELIKVIHTDYWIDLVKYTMTPYTGILLILAVVIAIVSIGKEHEESL